MGALWRGGCGRWPSPPDPRTKALRKESPIAPQCPIYPILCCRLGDAIPTMFLCLGPVDRARKGRYRLIDVHCPHRRAPKALRAPQNRQYDCADLMRNRKSTFERVLLRVSPDVIRGGVDLWSR